MQETIKTGEVIEASTASFTAQCYELFQPPPLGSLVKTNEEETEIFAVVGYAQTAGIEPGRRPIARGQAGATADDIYRENPQLLKLLRSEFTALVVGHRQAGQICQYLPPRPARIHATVEICGAEEVREFGQSLRFLGILMDSPQAVSADEFLAAVIRDMSQTQADKHAFMVTAGRELASLCGNDFGRLKSILGRLK
ncbi:hypothetical protein ACFLTW_02640 [Chloroflexota bacterium]